MEGRTLNRIERKKRTRSRTKRNELDKEGELKADISLKVDELFFRWFSLPSTQRAVKEGLRQIRNKYSSDKEKPKSAVDHPVSISIPPSVSPPPPCLTSDKPLLSPRRKSISRASLPVSPKQSTAPTSPTAVKTTTFNNSKLIPKFYFPSGEPGPPADLKRELKEIASVFDSTGKNKLSLSELVPVAKACGCPVYWKSAIFKAASTSGSSCVTKQEIVAMWKRVASSCHDDASRFVKMLAKPGKSFLEFQDFLALMKDVVESHPGLMFLREAPEFHTRYMNTVIARIFYTVNRSWSGQISPKELRRSNFLEVLSHLDTEDDINAISDYFSYEHFYVIYCKFWELDTDHDLVIDKSDLSRHAGGALSSRLIDRVLCGAVTRWDASDHRSQKMSYVDFVWFLISEEDKKTDTSIEYWFRCMDLDGDGRISMYEMEYFYEEQINKLEQLDIEPLPFEDCVCQMLDMVKPAHNDYVTLRDLKACKMAGVFFDTFFNVEKYLDHEQKDPFAPQKDIDSLSNEPSDWEKFAMEEYDILVAEEQASEQHDSMSYNEEMDHLIEEEFKKLGLEAPDLPFGDQRTPQETFNFPSFLP